MAVSAATGGFDGMNAALLSIIGLATYGAIYRGSCLGRGVCTTAVWYHIVYLVRGSGCRLAVFATVFHAEFWGVF